MPLRIVTARNKKTKNLYIRGTYLGIEVDESRGTDRRSVARQILRRVERSIELGEHPKQQARSGPPLDEPTFLDAATAYLEAGRSPRYVAALIKHFGETTLSQIDQAAIDKAAMTLRPNVSNGTRNTCVYTPTSAILHHAHIKITVKRPPGAKGRTITDWMPPVDAFGVIGAADIIDAEFGTLLAFLLYTGPRIGGSLNLQRSDVDLANGVAWARPQKGQQPMAVKLNEDLRERLATHLASHDRERVFRFRHGGHLCHLLARAKLAYLGLPCPQRWFKGWKEPPNRLSYVTSHIFRHTWATWMRKFGGATRDDLADSGNWKDRRSADRYVHAVAEGVWDRVDALPSMEKSGERAANNR